MFSLRRLQVLALSVLAVLLIGVAVTVVYANRDSDDGITDDDIYWDAFVANVKYDRAADTTNSDHGIYVENDGTSVNVEADYEFTHRVMKGNTVVIPEKKRTNSEIAYRMNWPVKKAPRNVNDTEEYRVDVSSLDGPGHKIDAYTRLTLIGQGVDNTFKLVVDGIEFQ